MSEYDIFQKALEIDEIEDRARYINQACNGDLILKKRIEKLLSATLGSDSLLSKPACDIINLTQLISRTHDGTDDAFEASSQVAQETTQEQSVSLSDGYSDTRYSVPFPETAELGTLGHYNVRERIGQGSFGSVFKAYDNQLNRFVAIKVMDASVAASDLANRRFLREARSAAALNHEHIVLIYEIEEQPVPYIVMELIEGPTLQQYFDDGHKFSIAEIVEVGRQVACALSAAHARSVIHRDIKPSNILLETDSEKATYKVKITDFGLARLIDEPSLTRTGYVSGTPKYMSPEQVRGETLDGRADLFSLGSVLYLLATGSTPFNGNSTLEVMSRVAQASPIAAASANPELPQWLCDIIARLHARDKRSRFQSADEVIASLRQYQEHQTGTSQVRHPKSSSPPVGLLAMARPVAPTGKLTSNKQSAVRQRSANRRWLVLYGTIMSLANVALVTYLLIMPIAQQASNAHGVVAVTDSQNAVKLDGPPRAIAPFTARQARDHQELWAQHLRIPADLTNSLGIKFVLIPPGEFRMGSSEDATELLAHTLLPENTLLKTVFTEAPAHKVVISQPFYMSVYEVTESQYQSVIRKEPSFLSLAHLEQQVGELSKPLTELAQPLIKLAAPLIQQMQPAAKSIDKSQHPVVNVTWKDAVQFCIALSQAEELAPSYVVDNDGVTMEATASYRLPTEGEWEYACRAGTTTLFWTGSSIADTAVAEWFKRSQEDENSTHVVGERKANPFGLYDMHGNVSEWTEEEWQPDAYARNAHARLTVPPAHASSDSIRVFRGGSFLQYSNRSRAAHRPFRSIDSKGGGIGFRLVIDAASISKIPDKTIAN